MHSSYTYDAYDGLGSTTLTVEPLSGGGAETESYQYDAFGALRSGSLQTLPYSEAETILCTGEQFDARARHDAGGLYVTSAPLLRPVGQDDLPRQRQVRRSA